MSFDFSGDIRGMNGSPLLNSQGQFTGMLFKGEGNRTKFWTSSPMVQKSTQAEAYRGPSNDVG